MNICDEKYMHIAALIHARFHETLISACTGSSSAKWIIEKIGVHLFKKKPN